MATSFGSNEAQKRASWRELFDPPVTGVGDENVSGTVNCNGPWRIKPTLPTPRSTLKSRDWRLICNSRCEHHDLNRTLNDDESEEHASDGFRAARNALVNQKECSAEKAEQRREDKAWRPVATENAGIDKRNWEKHKQKICASQEDKDIFPLDVILPKVPDGSEEH